MELVNSALSTDFIRMSMMIGGVALAAHAVQPVPDVLKNNLYNNTPLKFTVLLLTGVAFSGDLNWPRLAVIVLVCLFLIVIFEYWRQIDRERAAIQAEAHVPKERMWERDPYGRLPTSYPHEAPYGDHGWGIPTKLPSGSDNTI